MNIVANIIRPLLVCLTVLIMGIRFGDAAEIDDATVFVDAFAAYQKKDYLLTMEKVEQLNPAVPRFTSPGRGVIAGGALQLQGGRE